MRHCVLAALVSASLALACQVPKADDELGTDDTESGSGTDTTESEGGGTDETAAGPVECECIANQPIGETPEFPFCGETLCDKVLWHENDEEVTELQTVEAAQCSLAALRDRTPGVVTWSNTSDFDFEAEDGYVLIYDDGTAAIRSWGPTNELYVAGEGVRFELPDPAYYDDCLTTMDYECIKTGPHPDNGIAALETCVENWANL